MSAAHKFTPGPWHVEPEKDGVCVMAGDYYITDTIDAAGDDSDDTTHHANARLIAAAPDLLAELSWIRRFIVKDADGVGVVIKDASGKDIRAWIDRADATIAKATGATS